MAPSFLDLEEAPAASGSGNIGGHCLVSFLFPIKALSVYQGLGCAEAQKARGPSMASLTLSGSLSVFSHEVSPWAFFCVSWTTSIVYHPQWQVSCGLPAQTFHHVRFPYSVLPVFSVGPCSAILQSLALGSQILCP